MISNLGTECREGQCVEREIFNDLGRGDNVGDKLSMIRGRHCGYAWRLFNEGRTETFAAIAKILL